VLESRVDGIQKPFSPSVPAAAAEQVDIDKTAFGPITPLSRRQAMTLADDQWIPTVEALLREIILPRAEDAPLPHAEQELDDVQRRYFDLLDNERPADALELAQKTQACLEPARWSSSIVLCSRRAREPKPRSRGNGST
jgi:hypothetical protein